VRIIVGFAAGGGVDIVARLIGQWLSERLGQPFVIENRPGAGTNIATEAVVRAAADGYTLLLVNTANAINATFYDKLNFNFIRDIAPVAGIMVVPNVMLVHPSVPAKTVPEFIAYANAPTSGSASLLSLRGEWFRCNVQHDSGALWITKAAEGIVGGMSGSPILADDGSAIGVYAPPQNDSRL
jgi:Tripartite tricarboxylate transporter family receptor